MVCMHIESSTRSRPLGRRAAGKLLDGLDAESIHKIVRGNAIDLFELQGFQ